MDHQRINPAGPLSPRRNSPRLSIEQSQRSKTPTLSKRSSKFLEQHGTAIRLGQAAFNNDHMVKYLERNNSVALKIAPRSTADEAIDMWLGQMVSPPARAIVNSPAPSSSRRLNPVAAEFSPLESPRQVNMWPPLSPVQVTPHRLNPTALAFNFASTSLAWHKSSNRFVDDLSDISDGTTSSSAIKSSASDGTPTLDLGSPNTSTSTSEGPKTSAPSIASGSDLDFDDDFDGWDPVRRDRRSYAPSIIDNGSLAIFS